MPNFITTLSNINLKEASDAIVKAGKQLKYIKHTRSKHPFITQLTLQLLYLNLGLLVFKLKQIKYSILKPFKPTNTTANSKNNWMQFRLIKDSRN